MAIMIWQYINSSHITPISPLSFLSPLIPILLLNPLVGLVSLSCTALSAPSAPTLHYVMLTVSAVYSALLPPSLTVFFA